MPRAKTSTGHSANAVLETSPASSRPCCRVSPALVSVAPDPPATLAGTIWFSKSMRNSVASYESPSRGLARSPSS